MKDINQKGGITKTVTSVQLYSKEEAQDRSLAKGYGKPKSIFFCFTLM